MEAVKAPRGTRDILGDESWKWAYVTQMCRDVADDYGYKEVYLPIFEHTELFCRGVGETTDVVEKEMYTFTDKGGRSITLRPELTASMVRSYLENEMNKGAQPAKLWSIGPMFRYERPQKGRYRQFVQLDIEALGAQDAFVDLEVIDFSMELYRRLGLSNLQVILNSVGCPKCRPVYRKALCARATTSSATPARAASTETRCASSTARARYARKSPRARPRSWNTSATNARITSRSSAAASTR